MNSEVREREYTDTQRLDWVMDILSLTENNGDAKAMRLCAAVMLGKQGRDAIDTAMLSEAK